MFFFRGARLLGPRRFSTTAANTITNDLIKYFSLTGAGSKPPNESKVSKILTLPPQSNEKVAINEVKEENSQFYGGALPSFALQVKNPELLPHLENLVNSSLEALHQYGVKTPDYGKQFGVSRFADLMPKQGTTPKRSSDPYANLKLPQPNDEVSLEYLKSLLKTPAGTPKPGVIVSSNRQSGHAALSGDVLFSANSKQEKPKKKISISRRQSMKYLSQELGVKLAELVKKANALSDVRITEQSFVGQDIAELLADAYKAIIEKKDKVLQSAVDKSDPAYATYPIRAPVVCVMGHVDHGKTTLLDTLRNTSIAKFEAGGITQSIGAFKVPWTVESKENSVGYATFLDTPGHAIFRKMRERGADSELTDIVILIIDIFDGIKDQTKESIQLVKRAGIPMVVALNKCDIPGGDPEKVRKQLMTFGVVPEEKGGDTLCVEISAKNGTGIDDLKAAIQMTAEMVDLRSPTDIPAECSIVEAFIDKGLGPVVHAIVRKGTLRVGDYVVSGNQYTKVRKLLDATGATLQSAGPSTPLRMVGFDTLTGIDSKLAAAKDEDEAREVALTYDEGVELATFQEAQAKANVANFKPRDSYRQSVSRRRSLLRDKPLTDEESAKEKERDEKTVTLYLKSDVLGSMDALTDYIALLGNDEVRVEVARLGVGAVNKTDIDWASHFNATIACFAVPVQESVKQYALQKGVKIKSQNIIYNLMDDIQELLSEKLGTEMKTITIGSAKVLQTFEATGKKKTVKMIAGLVVENGSLTNEGRYQVIRDKKVIWTGELESLKIVKETVSTVEQGKECGLKLEGFDEFKVGDIIKNIKDEKTQRIFDDTMARELNPDFQETVLSQSSPLRQSLAFRSVTPEAIHQVSQTTISEKKLKKLGKSDISDTRFSASTMISPGWKSATVLKPKKMAPTTPSTDPSSSESSPSSPPFPPTSTSGPTKVSASQ